MEVPRLWLNTILILAAAAAPAHVSGQAAASTVVRQVVRVRGDLYRVEDGARSTMFLVTADGIILGDPLSSSTSQWLKDDLAGRFPGRAVRYVVQSFHSFDRAGGAGVFKADAEIVGHRDFNSARMKASRSLPSSLADRDKNRNGRLDRDEWVGSARASLLAEYDSNGDGIIAPFELYDSVEYAKTTYESRRVLTLGGKTVQIVNPGGAYRSDTTALYFQDEHVLFSPANPVVTSGSFSFGASNPKDVISWMHALVPLEFDTLVSGRGETVSRADFLALVTYLDDLVAAVAADYKAGLTVAQVQARPIPDKYRGGPFEAARRENVATVYDTLRVVTTNIWGAALLNVVRGNSNYCVAYQSCETGGRIPAGMVGVRVDFGRFSAVVETMSGGQIISSRSSSLYDDAFAHRDSRTSFLFRHGAIHPGRRSFGLLIGPSLTLGDTLGVSRVKQGFAPFAGRHSFAERSSRLGLTVGADLVTPLNSRVSVVVPFRVTKTAGKPEDAWSNILGTTPTDTWPGLLDLQVGIGFGVRMSQRIK